MFYSEHPSIDELQILWQEMDILLLLFSCCLGKYVCI